MADSPPTDPDPVVPGLATREGRVLFPARRPAALVLPLAAVTELGGILCLATGATIGWVVCAAPFLALAFTGALLRPVLELTREGLVQRQFPFSSLTRWEVIEGFGIARAGNRVILGYRLVEGIPAPRRQPAAALLRAAKQPYDGGYFADSLAAAPDVVLGVVTRYLADAGLRDQLPEPRPR